MTKLCKDCRYSKKLLGSYWCEHIPSVGISSTDGQVNAYRCSTSRSHNKVMGKCGPNAVFFDPKLTCIQKFLQLFRPAPNL